MAYILDGTTIRSPHEISESNDTQVAQNRALNGTITRDYFGSNKRQWVLQYDNVQKSEYETIRTIYDSYMSTNTVKSWEITETNYTVAATTVHIDLKVREFRVRGEDYISDFTLTLTEN